MLPQDTLSGDFLVIPDTLVSDTLVSHAPRSPYEVLKRLPANATPAQQDSAIQAWYQPGEIHFSERPDTLHLPGHEPGEVPFDKHLPLYYRENFFSTHSLLTGEMAVARYGVAGDPVPYRLRSDNTITSLLLLCFVVFCISVANSRQFIRRQLRDIFYPPKNEDTIFETAGELRFQLFLTLQGCLLLAITTFLYAKEYISETYNLLTDLQLVGILFGSFVAYDLLKGGLYTVANRVFFEPKKNSLFLKIQLFNLAFTGVLFFPPVLLLVYFNLDIERVTYYYIFVLVCSKILTFYKCWAIFFRQKGFFLQIFLYFCALEIVPLLAFGGLLVMILNLLKVNF